MKGISQRTLMSEGRAEGEKAKAIAAARVLLSKNVAANVIAEATGLTPAKIAELGTETNNRS